MKYLKDNRRYFYAASQYNSNQAYQERFERNRYQEFHSNDSKMSSNSSTLIKHNFSLAMIIIVKILILTIFKVIDSQCKMLIKTTHRFLEIFIKKNSIKIKQNFYQSRNYKYNQYLKI